MTGEGDESPLIKEQQQQQQITASEPEIDSNFNEDEQRDTSELSQADTHKNVPKIMLYSTPDDPDLDK